MNQRIQLVIGAVVVLAVLIGVGVFSTLIKPPASVASGPTATVAGPVTVNCIVGSEKQPLLDDPDLQKIFASKYQLTVTYTTKGSMDQVSLPADQLKGVDCLWPSNISASLLYQQENPGYKGSPVPVLFSPIVVYSTIEARDTLKSAGYVEQRGDQYFIIKMNDLVKNLVLQGGTWQSQNAPTLKGPVKVQSTDPGRSNSGFLLFGLYANIIAGDAYTPASLATSSTVLPALKKLKDLQGLQFAGSEDAFNSWYAQNGFGSPLFAAYESQILERSVVDTGFSQRYGTLIYTLYPEPSIQAVHVIIPLTANAQRLITAMKDPDVQALAWKKHGFRSLVGAPNDPKDFPLISVPQNVQTTDLPPVDMTSKVLDCLRNSVCQ